MFWETFIKKKTKKNILHPQAKQLKKTQNIVLLLRFVYVFPSHYIIMHFKYASEIMSKPSRFDVFDKNDSTATVSKHIKNFDDV